MPVRVGILAAVLAVAAGCGGDQALPVTGAKGPVVLQRWDGDPDRPAVVVADGIRARDRGFRHLELERVRARIPLTGRGGPRGWLAVEAPSGSLAPVAGDRVGQLVLDGPIRLHGSLDGAPFVGRAASASLLARDGVARFHELALIDSGLPTRMREGVFTREKGLDAVELLRDGEFPADLHAAYAALPWGYVPPDPTPPRP
ncbi:MAG: hypothetical protein RLZZ127_2647 [Planctomycetota bacterium]|jgi:hypothetical protein